MKRIILLMLLVLISGNLYAHANTSRASAYQIKNDTRFQFDLVDSSNIPTNIVNFPAQLPALSSPINYLISNDGTLPQKAFTIRYYQHDSYVEQGRKSDRYCDFIWDPNSQQFLRIHESFHYFDWKSGDEIEVNCNTDGRQIIIYPEENE